MLFRSSVLLLLIEKCLNNAFNLPYKSFISPYDFLSDVLNILLFQKLNYLFSKEETSFPIGYITITTVVGRHLLWANVQIYDYVPFINTG